MTIRLAVVADANVLANLNGLVQELHVSARPDHFKPTSAPDLAEWYGSLLSKPATRIWIAEEDGKPVGYVMAVLHETQGNLFIQARRWCEIDQIAVDSNYREKGVARALLLEALASARAEGINVIETSCWSFNGDAHVFFQRLGFLPKSVRLELMI